MLEGAWGPPPYTMENKWRPYVTCQQLPGTGAVTSQGSEREAPLYGKHQCGECLRSWARRRSQVQSPALCDTLYSVCSSLKLFFYELKFQLAWRKTPVTLRWRLHKPVTNSRAGVSFKLMIRAVNKHNKASNPRGSPALQKSTMNMFMCSETNCETWTVLTIVMIVACENRGGIPCPLTISKTHTDVNYSANLWLIFQSPTAEREGFTNSSQTEADSRLTRTVPLLCALTMSYRWGHNGRTTWHPVAWGGFVWLCVWL